MMIALLSSIPAEHLQPLDRDLVVALGPLLVLTVAILVLLLVDFSSRKQAGPEGGINLGMASGITIVSTVLALISGLLEMVSVAAILPFLAVLSDPTRVETHALLHRVYSGLGFTTTMDFLIFLSLCVLGLVVISLGVRMVSIYASYVCDVLSEREEDVQRMPIDSDNCNALPDWKAVCRCVRFDYAPGLLAFQCLRNFFAWNT